MREQLTLENLQNMPTLRSEQAGELKIDTTFTGGSMRVWLFANSLDKNDLAKVRVERLVGGQWKDVSGREGRKVGHMCVHELDGGFSTFFVLCNTKKEPTEQIS